MFFLLLPCHQKFATILIWYQLTDHNNFHIFGAYRSYHTSFDFQNVDITWGLFKYQRQKRQILRLLSEKYRKTNQEDHFFFCRFMGSVVYCSAVILGPQGPLIEPSIPVQPSVPQHFFLLDIFSSFSFAVFLLLCKKKYFSFPINFLLFLLFFFSSAIFFPSGYIFPFHSSPKKKLFSKCIPPSPPFSFSSPQKGYFSFSKYSPPCFSLVYVS